MTVRRTNRWRGVTAITLLAVAAGVLTNQPGALLVGVVGVAYAAYARQSDPPEPDLDVERTVSETTPDLGDEVTVTVTVRNDGGFLPDIRLVDGVPDALEVEERSPRLATALRAGKTASFSYTLTAERGRHEFDPLTVITRDGSSALERERTLSIETTIECTPRLADFGTLPLRASTVRRVGTVPTNEAGSGVEFHAVRDYRPGDPLSRVDWRRLARTGELSTVEFRREHAATVVAVVDAREPSHTRCPDDQPVVDYAVQAAGGVVAARLDEGDRAGVAAFGPHWEWTAPGIGRDHRERVRRTLALDTGYAAHPPERRFLGGLVFRRLRKHLPANAQVVWCSPLLDDDVVDYLRRLEATGHPVTVVSPDPTRRETPGQRLASIERTLRIRDLRRAGIRVVDWDVTDSLPVTLAGARRGWRR